MLGSRCIGYGTGIELHTLWTAIMENILGGKIINVTNESKLMVSVPGAYMATADAEKQLLTK